MEKKPKKTAVLALCADADPESIRGLLRAARQRGYKSVLIGETGEEFGADLTLALTGRASFPVPSLAALFSDYDLVLDRAGCSGALPLSREALKDPGAILGRLEGSASEGESGLSGEIKLVLQKGEDRFGPGGYELLSRIGETGSIQAAAREMGLSYSKALKLVKMAERFGRKAPFLLRSRGGEGGGRTVLTEEGSAFLSAYASMLGETRALTEGVLKKYFP